MKRIAALLLSYTLLLLMTVPPVFAATDFAVTAGNGGIASKTVYFNGKAYVATTNINYSSDKGAFLVSTCYAYINYALSNATVKYDTKNYGYITNSGGAVQGQFTSGHTTVSGGYVPCSKGMDQVIDWLSISGTGYFYGDTTVEIPVLAQK